jgi:very-short-patch-repair endonuclease
LKKGGWGGFKGISANHEFFLASLKLIKKIFIRINLMLYYHPKLKFNARKLRINSSEAEKKLWAQLRNKQLLNIQFYRQKPIERYIVDFYAPKVKLIIELDGGQHYEEDHKKKDRLRDLNLNRLGFKVMRFDNIQVLGSLNEVLEMIFEEVKGRVVMK